MTDDLTSLKQHPKILDLYRSRLSLKQDGRRWRGPCVFHSDKHATNFDVYQHEGTWIYKCLSCNVSGSILDLLQQTDGTDFKGAVKIARDFTSDWQQSRASVEATFRPLSTPAKEVKTYPESSYKNYEEALKNSPEAQKFLQSRGISTQTAQRLRIGFRQDVGKLAGESNADIANRGWLAFPTFGRSGDGSNKPVVTSIKYRSIVRKAFTKQPGMKNAMFNLE